LFLLLLAAPATAADEPIALRWALQEGDTFYTTTRIAQNHTLDAAGRKLETSLNLDFSLRYRVTAVKEGETTVEVTYLAADLQSEGLPGVAAIGESVRGCSVTLRLDENHSLRAVRVHDEILKKFRKFTAVERDTAEVLFGESGIRELVGRPFEILPRIGMRVGETATRDDGGIVGGLTTTGKTTSKLERLDGGIAKVSVKAELAITTGDGPGAFAVPGAKIELKSDRAGGSYTFDTRTGRVKEFTYETVIGGSVTTAAGGKDSVVGIAIRQKQTVVVSDKNPVRD